MRKIYVFVICFFSLFSFAQNEPVSTNSGVVVQSNSAGTVQSDSGAVQSNSGELGDDSAFDQDQEQPVDDPYEKFNRVMFGFNEMLDRFIIKPAAELYNKIIPVPLNRGIDHMFENFYTPRTVLYDAMEYNFYQAVSDAWRVVLNTTVGIGGFFDVANKVGLPPNTEDFGLVLAQWGYKQSSYFVLPFFGPRTIRDSISIPVDYYTSFYPYFHLSAQFWIKTTDTIDKRAQLLRFQDVYDTASLDKYVFLRSAYIQRVNYLIDQNTQQNNPYTAEDMQKMHQDPQLDE